jgi:hypothetical protein
MQVALKKGATGDLEGKYKKLVLDAGRIVFDWDVSNQSLTDFELAAIDAILRLDDKQFATHAQAKDKEEKRSLGGLLLYPMVVSFQIRTRQRSMTKVFWIF